MNEYQLEELKRKGYVEYKGGKVGVIQSMFEISLALVGLISVGIFIVICGVVAVSLMKLGEWYNWSQYRLGLRKTERIQYT